MGTDEPGIDTPSWLRKVRRHNIDREMDTGVIVRADPDSISRTHLRYIAMALAGTDTFTHILNEPDSDAIMETFTKAGKGDIIIFNFDPRSADALQKVRHIHHLARTKPVVPNVRICA